jgi:hypothetical protein
MGNNPVMMIDRDGRAPDVFDALDDASDYLHDNAMAWSNESMRFAADPNAGPWYYPNALQAGDAALQAALNGVAYFLMPTSDDVATSLVMFSVDPGMGVVDGTGTYLANRARVLLSKIHFSRTVVRGTAKLTKSAILDNKTLRSWKAILRHYGITPEGIYGINYQRGNENCNLCAMAMDDYLASGITRIVDGGKPTIWKTQEEFHKYAGVTEMVRNIVDIRDIDGLLEEGDRALIEGYFEQAIPGLSIPGHIFNVTKLNGQIIYIDAQPGGVIHPNEIAQQMYSYYNLIKRGTVGDRRH